MKRFSTFFAVVAALSIMAFSVNGQSRIPEDVTKFLQGSLTDIQNVEEIKFDDLPEEAQTTALERFGDELYHFSDVYMIESYVENDEDGEPFFQTHFLIAFESDSETIKLLFDPKGSLVKKEVISLDGDDGK